MSARVFVPHNHCTMAGGDCFRLGRCLSACGAARKKDHETRIKDLERRLLAVEMQLAKKVCG